METSWIILTVIMVCLIALIIFLIIKNLKDEKEVIKSMNSQTEIDDQIEEELEQNKFDE